MKDQNTGFSAQYPQGHNAGPHYDKPMLGRAGTHEYRLHYLSNRIDEFHKRLVV